VVQEEQQKKKFTLLYGYYACMGGFAVDCSKMDTSSFPNSFRPRTRMTITIPGIIELARRGVFVDIDTATIKDKSKADVLAKGLVIFQVTWMVVQVHLSPIRRITESGHAYGAAGRFLLANPRGTQSPSWRYTHWCTSFAHW
jgi:uncharacterized membrane protein